VRVSTFFVFPPDLNMLEAGAQCFPLYLYSKVENKIDEKMMFNLHFFLKIIKIIQR